MPSPTCLVNGASTANGADVSPGSTVTIQLADLAGVGPWSISCTSTDETQDSATITSSLSINQTTKTATFTMPASTGVALRFKSVVGTQTLGVQDGVVNSALTTYFVVHTLVGGLRVGAFGEERESGPFGSLPKLNAAIRTLGAGSAVSLSGDVTGTTAASVVSFIDGIAVPGGAPSTNDFLVASSPTGLTYRTIGVADLPSLSGDVVGAVNSTQVHGIGTGAAAATVSVATATILQWASGGGALLTIADTTGPSGNEFQIKAQNSTSGAGFGGNVVLNSGHGTVSNGAISLEIDGTLVLQIVGSNKRTNLGVGNNAVQIGTATSSVSAYGHTPVGKPSVSAAISSIVDPNAQLFAQQITAALGDGVNGIGWFTDSTT